MFQMFSSKVGVTKWLSGDGIRWLTGVGPVGYRIWFCWDGDKRLKGLRSVFDICSILTRGSLYLNCGVRTVESSMRCVWFGGTSKHSRVFRGMALPGRCLPGLVHHNNCVNWPNAVWQLSRRSCCFIWSVTVRSILFTDIHFPVLLVLLDTWS